LHSYLIKETILEKFHNIDVGSDHEFHFECSAIFGCVEFEGMRIRDRTVFSFNHLLQPVQAIKEEVSKLRKYMSNLDRKGFYELKLVCYSFVIFIVVSAIFNNGRRLTILKEFSPLDFSKIYLLYLQIP
jgi:hypothetical protein